MSARIGATVRSFGAALAALFFSFAALAQIGVGGPLLGSQPAGSISAAAYPLRAPDGSASAPSYSFATDSQLGLYRSASNTIGFAGSGVFMGNWSPTQMVWGQAGAGRSYFNTSIGITIGSGVAFNWSPNTDATIAAGDLFLKRFATKQVSITGDGTGTASTMTGWILGNIGTTNSGIWHSALTPTLNNAAVISDVNGQTFFNAPIGQAASISINQTQKLIVTTALTTIVPPLLISTAATANQVRTAQTTPPTCTTNCGTPGNVCVGTDTAMKCTMGTTPASGILITFNGTWPAAPSCVVQMALSGMVVGKQILTTSPTTTTLTLVTNGTAPATGDKYDIICIGVS